MKTLDSRLSLRLISKELLYVLFWVFVVYRTIQIIMKYGLEELGVWWLVGLALCGVALGLALDQWFDRLDKNKDT